MTVLEHLDEMEEDLRSAPSATEARLALLEGTLLRLLPLFRAAVAGGAAEDLGVLESNHRRFMAEIRERQARGGEA